MQRCLFSTVPRSSFALAAPFKSAPAKRLIHDIVISRTGKPIIRTPRGGRCVSNCHNVFFIFAIFAIFEHRANGSGIGLRLEVRAPNKSYVMRSKLKDEPGHTVTVFGASGQLGRYIVNRLGMDGLASEERDMY